MMGYDAVSIHSASQSMGRDFLIEAMEEVSAPFVSLNAIDKKTRGFLGPPFVVQDAGKLRVAIAALTDRYASASKRAGEEPAGHSGMMGKPVDDASEKALEEFLEILDPVESLEKYLPSMQARSEIIVLMSPFDPESNAELAGRFPEIDLILGIGSEKGERVVGSTLIVDNKSTEGKKLGRLSLGIDADGRIVEHEIEWLPIRKTLAEDPRIRKHVGDFYDAVAANEELWEDVEPLFASLELEMDKTNKYTSAFKCASCHEEIYSGWRKSEHAAAYDTLVKQNRYFYPDCVNCHTTGAGYPSGFRIDQTTKHLEGVQCEVCHGPGGKHVASEGEADMRVTSDREFCRGCHDSDVSPDLDTHFEHMLAKVNHTDVEEGPRTSKKEMARTKRGTYPNISRLRKEQPALWERLYRGLAAGCRSSHLLFECKGKSAAEKRGYLDGLLETDHDFDSLMAKMTQRYGDDIKSGKKKKERYRVRRQSVAEALEEAVDANGGAALELFVMSYGPRAIEAERLLYELRDEFFGDTIRLTLRFIAKERERENPGAGQGEASSKWFESLNGQKEVDEDIRQLLIQEYHPDKLQRYLLVRNTSIVATDWKQCAVLAGIDPEEIEKRIAGGEGAHLLLEDARLAESKRITISPTLLIDGERFLGRFER